jgi:hypothetical protein
MAKALHSSQLPHAACAWRRLIRGKFYCRSTHNVICGTLAFFIGGSNLTMSPRSHRSNPDTSFLLTAGIHYAYTRANTFISTPFTAVVSLMTSTLRTRPCATRLQSPHARVQRSLSLPPNPSFGKATAPHQNLSLSNRAISKHERR